MSLSSRGTQCRVGVEIECGTPGRRVSSVMSAAERVAKKDP